MFLIGLNGSILHKNQKPQDIIDEICAYYRNSGLITDDKFLGIVLFIFTLSLARAGLKKLNIRFFTNLSWA